jgi:hypothetical protein
MTPDPTTQEYRSLAEQLIGVTRGLAMYYRIRRRSLCRTRYAVEWAGVCLTAEQAHALLTDTARRLRALQDEHPALLRRPPELLIPRALPRQRRPYLLPAHRPLLISVTSAKQAEIRRLWERGYGPRAISRKVNLSQKIIQSYVLGA